jgi:hypothetical protein
MGLVKPKLEDIFKDRRDITVNKPKEIKSYNYKILWNFKTYKRKIPQIAYLNYTKKINWLKRFILKLILGWELEKI